MKAADRFVDRVALIAGVLLLVLGGVYGTIYEQWARGAFDGVYGVISMYLGGWRPTTHNTRDGAS